MQTYPHPLPADLALSRSRNWVDQMVIGLNLCPFAAPDQRAGRVRYALSDAEGMATAVADFLVELERIQQADASDIATTLLILNRTGEAFETYLDLLDQCQGALQQAGLEGVFQLASFHPRYCFAGVDADDLSNWTNRSPLPMIHLIREGQMSRVLAHYQAVEEIPERNIERLRTMGRAGLLQHCPVLAEYWPEAKPQL
ncbi:DUF1415 domain-containing protein [Pontibacter sp. JAM-7]|uniref:DUF1415 domain-containing protein n=1 Tax=Pontibacter sp. JAM-7 TaxID=3366581 RepID=UPI003AF8CFA7